MLHESSGPVASKEITSEILLLLISSLKLIHLLTNKTVYGHLLILPVVLTSLGYRGSITLENLNLITHCCYLTLDVEWGNFKLYIHDDPIVLPKRVYVYGFQPNLLTEFDAPSPYRIQFIASYLDLCTPTTYRELYPIELKILDFEACLPTPN